MATATGFGGWVMTVAATAIWPSKAMVMGLATDTMWGFSSLEQWWFSNEW